MWGHRPWGQARLSSLTEATPRLALRPRSARGGGIHSLSGQLSSAQGRAPLEGWDGGVPCGPSVQPSRVALLELVSLALASFVSPLQSWQPRMVELTSQQPLPVPDYLLQGGRGKGPGSGGWAQQATACSKVT